MVVPNTAAGSFTAQDLSGVCILVLDDDPNMRSLIRGMLASCGCQNILQSGDAREALRMFSTSKVDLVISDWRMDPMSGLEFLRELRLPERRLNMPVIMLTASSEPQDMVLAQQFKISAWLVKPIVPRQLLERIGTVLSLPDKSLSLDKDLGIEVARLAEQYHAKLVNDLRDLDNALAGTKRNSTQRRATVGECAARWEPVHRILHNIKGQAGSFGFGLVTSVAALGLELTGKLLSDIDLIDGHHDELYRCMTALVQAMRLVLQNEIRGDGGQIGERLLAKLRDYTAALGAKFDAGSGST